MGVGKQDLGISTYNGSKYDSYEIQAYESWPREQVLQENRGMADSHRGSVELSQAACPLAKSVWIFPSSTLWYAYLIPLPGISFKYCINFHQIYPEGYGS